MPAVHTMRPVRSNEEPGKFLYLFLAQVLSLVLYPWLNQPGLPILVFRLLGGLAFIAAVYATSDNRLHWMTAAALSIPTAALNVVSAFRPDRRNAVPTLLCTVVFLLFTLITLLKTVLRAERVTRDTIYGALSVYLLMAITWGAAYMLLCTLQPAAIAMDHPRHPNAAMDWSDCVYYSFVTLTTLGYGDVVPMTAQARSLSILEAITGIMYVAVLIAHLVSLNSAGKSPRNLPEA